MRARPSFISSLFFALFLTSLTGGTAAADDMAEIQTQLNAETANSEFHTEDVEKIDTYIAEAMKKKLQPKTAAPSGWQPGQTCDGYYRRYSRYNYYGYRDCLYHYRYYGRYW